jgi:myo-inositol-1(or 4)-monophosphatase
MDAVTADTVVPPGLPRLLQLARGVVEAAEHRLPDGPHTVTETGDRDKVSDVDIAVERQIRAALREATPDDGFLGEEEGLDGPDGPTCWILDPVDGTANFIPGMPMYAIALALVHQQTPVPAVISLPYLRRRYWAATGLGAWRNDRRIRPSPVQMLREAMVAIGDFGTGRNSPERERVDLAVLEALAAQAQPTRMLGTSAADLAFVADGTLDASVTLANRSWDMAAGAVIAREAGATVTDLDGTVHTTGSQTTIASSPAIHGEVLALVRAAAAGTSYDPAAWHRQGHRCHRRIPAVIDRGLTCSRPAQQHRPTVVSAVMSWVSAEQCPSAKQTRRSSPLRGAPAQAASHRVTSKRPAGGCAHSCPGPSLSMSAASITCTIGAPR